MCPACTSPWGPERIQKGDYAYLLCSTCGTGSLEEGWEEASYGRGYFNGAEGGGYYNYEADSSLHLETAGRRIARVEEMDPPSMTLIDVGSALGYTLDAARVRGWTALGVEVSEHAATASRNRGHRIFGDLREVESASLGAVVFGQVLEHMPDPDIALSAAFELLSPGGAIFIETWDLESRTAQRFGNGWQQIFPPSVIHLFTSRGLTRILQTSGFVDVVIAPWAKRVSVGGYLGVLTGKLPKWLGRPMMWVANTTRVSRLAITYRFDDLIAVTARKSNG